MTSKEIRLAFIDFFKENSHQIVSSAPMVLKNDPTLMFTNAGMNQFKDIFLGNEDPLVPRVANSQKCLRVSGKHNDLEEVGHDTYHHTMFEMLGNWSFGDYFKEEAIAMAWKFLVEQMKLNPERLFATVFEGDKEDQTALDKEAKDVWAKFLPQERILNGSKKDNFWEMGDSGPCGPCSEIHIDLRSDTERKEVSGDKLINKDHPLVVEIWNLVFIQFNRKANGKLETLPKKHIDTGMGFERLCMAVQGKKSNYDTDIFQSIIQQISTFSNIPYGIDPKKDVAMRVVADHTRAVSFAITDGQLPSNNKAGYVIRRILRRAVRYAYTFLNQREPFMVRLVPALIQQMGDAYPELKKSEELLQNVIREEEAAFLRTLENGIKMLDELMKKAKKKDHNLAGEDAFVLYDTYGFPPDLTELILKENNLTLDRKGFDAQMQKQKNRSREDATMETEDWVVLRPGTDAHFVGYDLLENEVQITQYREITRKEKKNYQLVLNQTPFYAESGGQIGDTGYLSAGNEKIRIIDTRKENNLIIHFTDRLPANPLGTFTAIVDQSLRGQAAANHTATHLLHHILRKILGNHVEQKGSLVHPDYLRFDFSHFQKVSHDELNHIQQSVNELILENIPLTEIRETSLTVAQDMGAMALFGEKYGETVRVIQFEDSVELCGGTHVKSTSAIGNFIITSESAVAAGIRRIEAITGTKASEFIQEKLSILKTLESTLKAPKNLVGAVEALQDKADDLQKKVEAFEKTEADGITEKLIQEKEVIGDINFIGAKVSVPNADVLKNMAFQLKTRVNNVFAILAAEFNGKVNVALAISEDLVKEKNLNAGTMIRDLAKNIQGGGGGQPFLATAGGKNSEGIAPMIQQAKKIISG